MKGKKASKDAKDAEEKNEKARATLDEKLNQAHEEADKQTKALEKAMADAQAHHAKEDAALAELASLNKQQGQKQQKQKVDDDDDDDDDDLPSWAKDKAGKQQYDKDLPTWAQANADATVQAERDTALAELDTLKNQQKASSISFSSLSESQKAAENKIRELNGALAAAKIHEEEVVARTIRELKEKDMAELLVRYVNREFCMGYIFIVCLGLWLFLYYFVAIFHIEWCIRKHQSPSIMLCNNNSIAQHHHTNNNPSIKFQPFNKQINWHRRSNKRLIRS